MQERCDEPGSLASKLNEALRQVYSPGCKWRCVMSYSWAQSQPLDHEAPASQVNLASKGHEDLADGVDRGHGGLVGASLFAFMHRSALASMPYQSLLYTILWWLLAPRAACDACEGSSLLQVDTQSKSLGSSLVVVSGCVGIGPYAKVCVPWIHLAFLLHGHSLELKPAYQSLPATSLCHHGFPLETAYFQVPVWVRAS